jgi:hypothetical protein
VLCRLWEVLIGWWSEGLQTGFVGMEFGWVRLD